MTFKAFVFDVDGTICGYDGLLNLEAAHSIRWLRSLGYEVFLASGRGPWDTYYLGVFLGGTPVAVCENGGVVMTSPTELKIFANKEQCLRAYDELCKTFDNVAIKPVSARLTEVVLLRTFDSERGQSVLDAAGIPVKINDSKFALHLTNRGIDKGVGLREALRFLNIEPSEVIAIGDSETDVPMFDVCGYSVAVANASESVKSKADHVCKNSLGDGAVEAISYSADTLLSAS